MTELATFAAGCFWSVEATFRLLPSVTTAVGYSGGTTDAPTYEDICTGQTGHAEVVQVEFDPAVVSYEKLLDVFWKCHDPTTRNRQGPDVGTQYRSAIFCHNQLQQTAAEASKKKLNTTNSFVAPIVTEITSAATFYRAEEYHQQYLERRDGGTRCH